MGNMHAVYRRYCECLVSVDEQLGRLLETLESKNLLDNTIIVYAGDNGYIWGEHRLYAKHYPYEESIRIPYMVRAPRRFMPQPGRRAKQMILNIDLAPSLLDMAGIAIPEGLQGQSFVPILRSAETQGRDAWVYELFRDFPFGGRVAPHKALRTRQYKYIDWDKCRSPELYDLTADPRELINIFDSAQGQEIAPQLHQELARLKQKYQLV